MSGRIFDRLAAHYGKHSVFMDVDNIPIGVDFRAHIGETLRRTDIVLAVIGAGWMGARDDGEARIREESDPVRVEIETALARGAPIIPVLVDGAKMPDAAALPQSFGTFAFLNAAEVATGRDFDGQIGRLIAAIDRAAAARPDDAARYMPPRRRRRGASCFSVARAAISSRRWSCCWWRTSWWSSRSIGTSSICGWPR